MLPEYNMFYDKFILYHCVVSVLSNTQQHIRVFKWKMRITDILTPVKNTETSTKKILFSCDRYNRHKK